MGTDEVIRKTLALAQSQLSNYKTMDATRLISNSAQNHSPKSGEKSGSRFSTVSTPRAKPR